MGREKTGEGILAVGYVAQWTRMFYGFTGLLPFIFGQGSGLEEVVGPQC